ncbi:MAG: phosphoribosylformylglycinamidine synthase subunit PurQ [Candidatus Omnitrophica bacterium]|nr:phosphoribosylformylglycinamidine synthase subunit PurQ [Candidatus Omnitrophota bacterium]
MKFGVIVFPGSNCDHDCFHVVKNVLGQPVEYIWHDDIFGGEFDCIIVPGGFSYGDYLRTGAIARFSPAVNSLIDFANSGGPVIGICNGFQILLESGLLKGAMLRNTNMHFICKYVYIRVENIDTPFTNLCKPNQVLKIPIAHNEGNYYIDEVGLKDLKSNNQIVFRYSSKEGQIADKYNPNGAKDFIAGITNSKGNVLGLMPHPERCSEDVLNSTDGLLIFKSILNWTKVKT